MTARQRDSACMLYCNSMPHINVQLPVALIKEDNQIVAYTPALDISTVGGNEAEAKERFNELVLMFFEDLIENNTVDAVLIDLGWRKNEQQWVPPQVTQQSISVQVPAFA